MLSSVSCGSGLEVALAVFNHTHFFLSFFVLKLCLSNLSFPMDGNFRGLSVLLHLSSKVDGISSFNISLCTFLTYSSYSIYSSNMRYHRRAWMSVNFIISFQREENIVSFLNIYIFEHCPFKEDLDCTDARTRHLNRFFFLSANQRTLNFVEVAIYGTITSDLNATLP